MAACVWCEKLWSLQGYWNQWLVTYTSNSIYHLFTNISIPHCNLLLPPPITHHVYQVGTIPSFSTKPPLTSWKRVPPCIAPDPSANRFESLRTLVLVSCSGCIGCIIYKYLGSKVVYPTSICHCMSLYLNLYQQSTTLWTIPFLS